VVELIPGKYNNRKSTVMQSSYRRSQLRKALTPLSHSKSSSPFSLDRKTVSPLSIKLKVRVMFKAAIMITLVAYFAPWSTFRPRSAESILPSRALTTANTSTFCCSIPTSDDVLKTWWKCCSSASITGDHKDCTALEGGEGDKCFDTVMTGGPYVECLTYWRAAAETDGESTFLKKKCSDMSSYPSMGADGFGGGVILYIMLLCYMFCGLAVICDEYFVPSLEVMAEKLDVSDDVAGATLMAAGGSAPELFTSAIGVFIARSDVGFSTIVGSAVFNVLFVIGMCAFFSKEPLALTGWPLTRDSVYYTITLLTLAMFYNNWHDGSGGRMILWWEAAIQLGLYFGYVLLMKYNETLKGKFDAKVASMKYKTAKLTPSKTEEDPENGTKERRFTNDDLVSTHGGNSGLSFRDRRRKESRTRVAVRFRVGILDILMGKQDGAKGKVQVQAIAGYLGNVRETFDQFDTNDNGFIDKTGLGKLLEKLMGKAQSEDTVNAALKDMTSDTSEAAGGEGQISYDEFKVWYSTAEKIVESKMDDVFNDIDTEKQGYMEASHFKEVLQKLHISERDFTDDEIAHGLELFGSDNQKVTKEDFKVWYRSTIVYTHEMSEDARLEHATEHEKADQEEAEEEGVSLAMPDGTAGRVMYFILLPLNALLYFTVPDVRWGKGWEKLYMVSFVLSIVWIGMYSYFMVWSATIFGDFAGIPQNVMGLTLLAAGTSVPDLISSVIVARQGHGDMAVSSSIGSNIFDVTVGLPLPWCLALIVFNEPYKLSPDGDLFTSLVILILMLISVIGTIIACKYVMSKALGLVMFGLYVVFVAQDLLRAYSVI
jgi:solute carrier family 24 (sodium/potassium/calcium exchanger), member 1